MEETKDVLKMISNVILGGASLILSLQISGENTDLLETGAVSYEMYFISGIFVLFYMGFMTLFFMNLNKYLKKYYDINLMDKI